jgi:hypothetical protein
VCTCAVRDVIFSISELCGCCYLAVYINIVSNTVLLLTIFVPFVCKLFY